MSERRGPHSVLVIDVGTSSIRLAEYTNEDRVQHEIRIPFPPETPADGLFEFDAARMAALVLDGCHRMHERCGPFVGVAIANQRGSAVLWDRQLATPVALALGWQDLRTIGLCLEMGATGHRFAPNQTATKATVMWDAVDPDRSRDLCVGTVDSWLAFVLSAGTNHITERSNAAITGLLEPGAQHWDEATLTALRLPRESMPTLVPTWGILGEASTLDGAPPILAMLGDQQASMLGQGCVTPGDSKMTFGTGGMFDMFLGDRGIGSQRSAAGCFPIVCWSSEEVPRRPTAEAGAPSGLHTSWGAEGILLAAGSAVDWLCDGLGLVTSPQATDAIAASVDSTDGVVFVASIQGEGTPGWDFGARGTLLGLTRGTTAPQIVRAVLEGVAFAADAVLRAAGADADLEVTELRIDGGMSKNRTFVQLLANATGLEVYPSPVVEATTLGAGRAAGLALGWFSSTRDIAEATDAVDRSRIVAPSGPAINREAWRAATEVSRSWYPELSAISF